MLFTAFRFIFPLKIPEFQKPNRENPFRKQIDNSKQTQTAREVRTETTDRSNYPGTNTRKNQLVIDQNAEKGDDDDRYFCATERDYKCRGIYWDLLFPPCPKGGESTLLISQIYGRHLVLFRSTRRVLDKSAMAA